MERKCKFCGVIEDNPAHISWTDEALLNGYAAEYHNSYICKQCEITQ